MTTSELDADEPAKMIITAAAAGDHDLADRIFGEYDETGNLDLVTEGLVEIILTMLEAFAGYLSMNDGVTPGSLSEVWVHWLTATANNEARKEADDG